MYLYASEHALMDYHFNTPAVVEVKEEVNDELNTDKTE
jgi:hypothetical protein